MIKQIDNNDGNQQRKASIIFLLVLLVESKNINYEHTCLFCHGTYLYYFVYLVLVDTQYTY